MNQRKKIILECVRQIMEHPGDYNLPSTKEEIATGLLAAAQQTHGEMMSVYSKIDPEFGIGEEGKGLIDENHPKLLNAIMQTFLNHHPEVQREIGRVAPSGEGTWHSVRTLIDYPHIHPVGHQIAIMHDRARKAYDDLFTRKDYKVPSPGSNYWWTR